MSRSPKTVLHFPVVRQLWKPAIATGAGGAAISVWWDEVMAFGNEILGLILLPIMAGIIFLMDIFFFRSRMPKPEDQQEPSVGRKEG